jgi:hypothetical protein
MYQAREIERRVMTRMAEFRQAQRDVAQHCEMAFDANTAEDYYRAGLEHCGVPRSETSGLNVFSLKALLKYRPRPGSPAWRDAPAMAYDSGEKSVLDDILA